MPAIVAAARSAARRLYQAAIGPTRFGYDAVEEKGQRRPPRVRQQAEDDELTASQRGKFTATVRDLPRNYAIAAWMIRKHLDYCATFGFQARTKNARFNRQLETYIDAASQPARFDVAQRHRLARFLRIAEARRTLEGDYFLLKLATGHVQGIEGDRIRTPWGSLPGGLKPEDLTHGVRTGPGGRATAYALCNRTSGGGFQFSRMIPARHIYQHAYFDRTDQVRGVGLVAPGVNTLQDTYEGISYALAKAKVTQLFGIKIQRAADDAMGDVTGGIDADGKEDRSDYTVDFGRGPFQLDLDPGDDADFLESKQPSAEFRAFTMSSIAIALKSVDIPYSFYDESFTNYAGNRQAWLLYDQGADAKRADNRELLDDWVRWRLRLAVLDGELTIPKSVGTVDDIAFEWIARGIPWIDPLKEIKADAEAVKLGVTSRRRICKRSGVDWFDILGELEEEERELRERRPTMPAEAPPEPGEELATLAERVDDLAELIEESLRHAA